MADVTVNAVTATGTVENKVSGVGFPRFSLSAPKAVTPLAAPLPNSEISLSATVAAVSGAASAPTQGIELDAPSGTGTVFYNIAAGILIPRIATNAVRATGTVAAGIPDGQFSLAAPAAGIGSGASSPTADEDHGAVTATILGYAAEPNTQSDLEAGTAGATVGAAAATPTATLSADRAEASVQAFAPEVEGSSSGGVDAPTAVVTVAAPIPTTTFEIDAATCEGSLFGSAPTLAYNLEAPSGHVSGGASGPNHLLDLEVPPADAAMFANEPSIAFSLASPTAIIGGESATPEGNAESGEASVEPPSATGIVWASPPSVEGVLPPPQEPGAGLPKRPPIQKLLFESPPARARVRAPFPSAEILETEIDDELLMMILDA